VIDALPTTNANCRDHDPLCGWRRYLNPACRRLMLQDNVSGLFAIDALGSDADVVAARDFSAVGDI
jgi:hypothetical protein